MSNYYFPAVAAVELGFLQTQGIDMELDMVFPVGRAMEALRDRRVDFVAGPAHATKLDKIKNLLHFLHFGAVTNCSWLTCRGTTSTAAVPAKEQPISRGPR